MSSATFTPAKNDKAVGSVVTPTTPPSELPTEKAARKPRTKQDGLAISFRITDPAEIDALTVLATQDRRSPENYVSLLVYKHVTGHIASSASVEKASGVV